MIGRTIFRTVVCALVIALAGQTPAARAQDSDVSWTIYAPTGDVAEIDINGSIAWIAADGGVVRIDLATAGSGSPNQKKLGDADGLVSPDLTALEIDSFGNVWVGTKTKGISVFDPEGRHVQNLDSFDTLRSDLVVDLRAAGNRMYVVCTDTYTAQGGFDGGGYVVVETTQNGGSYNFNSVGLGANVDFARCILPDNGVVWVGTSGLGLWKKDESSTQAPQVELNSFTGLLSDNVRRLVRAPNPDQGGASVLWIGTGEGLQTWDGANLVTIPSFQNQNILDLHLQGSTLLVLSETDALDRDIYRMDLSAPPLARARIPRSDCFADTLYAPREVALSAAGHVCLGTATYAFSIREPSSPFPWNCPPPLGPHFSQVSDLAIAADGVLYFATGEKGPLNPGVGIGRFDGNSWTIISEDDRLVNRDIHEVAAWPDTTMWFGSAISANAGGLSHYFPKTGAMVTYHDTVPSDAQRTQGKNCQSLELDRFGNLWVVIGQSFGSGGGLSVIEPNSLRITNFRVLDFAPGGNELLRDVAFDSRDRAWVTTFTDQEHIGTLYVIDPRGTLANESDDDYATFNVANEIFDLGSIESVEIDAQDQIWLAGEKGLAVGQIGADVGGQPSVAWEPVTPGVGQTGGRNPLPYTVAKLDTDGSIWFGTESAGVVHVSRDTNVWTWYDQESGAPLPDQSIKGLYLDKVARSLWIGTATAGIAKIDLIARSEASGKSIDPLVSPNPWRPAEDGPVAFRAMPADETVTMRIYNLAGELVYEGLDLNGAKTWDGTNVGNQLVEAGTYLLTATSADGKVYEGKVAILR